MKNIFRIKITFILLSILSIPVILPAYNVAESELGTVPVIEFENYTGPSSKVETVDEVRGIGTQISSALTEDNVWSRFHLKYSVIHAASDEEEEMLAADIFSIDRNALVNHIYNIRLILSAYLQSEYGYSSGDSWLLAEYITYYNAYYRGDIDYFTGKYKTVVLEHLTAENAGISTKYSEWPGNTRIVIPLTRYADEGILTSLDTTVIADDDIIDSMRLEDDMSIEEREEMIDLQQREVEELEETLEDENQQLEEKQDEAEQLEEDIAEKETQLEEAEDEETKTQIEEEIAEKEEELEETQAEIEETEENIEQLEEDITEREEQIAEEEQQLEEDKHDRELLDDPEQALQEVREREQEVEEREQELAEQEEALEEREQELTEQEEDLDEQEDRLRDELLDENIFGDQLYYMKINNYYDGGYYNNNMYIIDPETMQIVVKSTYNNISGNEFDIYRNGVVVIGYEGESLNNHRLIMLDPDTLAANDVSDDIIFHRSFVEVRDDYIYVISYLAGAYYLSKYDEKLERVARSSETVSEDTFISFFGDYVYVNSSDKDILVLNKEDLSLFDTIKP